MSKLAKQTRRYGPRKLLPLTIELYKHGSCPSEIARLEGVSRTHISLVLKGTSVSARIRKRIARILGKKVEELWAA